MDRGTVGARKEILAYTAHAIGEPRRIKEIRLVERRDQVVELIDGKILAEALDECALDIARIVVTVEQRDDEVCAHPKQNRFGREAGRIAQTDIGLFLLFDRKCFNCANSRLFHKSTAFTDATGFVKLRQPEFIRQRILYA